MSQTMAAPPLKERIHSIDLLRGLVMIIMALDHVRDFWGPLPAQPEDMDEPGMALFLTRWITHFCAPVFVFLAGTSAWLYRSNTGCSQGELQKFLITRGLWLVVIEVTVVNMSWGAVWQMPFSFLQVIWAIGCSMIVLGLVLPLGVRAIAVLGLLLVFGHNLLDGIASQQFGDYAILWMLVHEQNFLPILGGSWSLFIAYPLVPWIGVIMLGYAFGSLITSHPNGGWFGPTFKIGLAMTMLYIVLRLFGLYGDPVAWDSSGGFEAALISFLNVEKYPPSLHFLLMTIGPALMLMPWMEGLRGKAVDMISVFGRVPFFYYVIHLPLIHATAAIYLVLRYGSAGWQFAPPQAYPPEYSQSLLVVYAAWVGVIVVLYFPCRWYAALKRRRKDWWLSYL
ncbi:MAG: heparan-alpha-glucosaminide N-acetyltransferase domain-containing protein [Gammaproteobacteria bacterium]|nr:heparan-alpha-glucosaminide N-acetyltransferase domain-containing protein [Gammaproteobacteria bacterium]